MSLLLASGILLSAKSSSYSYLKQNELKIDAFQTNRIMAEAAVWYVKKEAVLRGRENWRQACKRS